MFGYATDETEECMPLTIVLAHKLNAKMAELRRNGTIPWLRPDSKTQVRLSAGFCSPSYKKRKKKERNSTKKSNPASLNYPIVSALGAL